MARRFLKTIPWKLFGISHPLGNPRACYLNVSPLFILPIQTNRRSSSGKSQQNHICISILNGAQDIADCDLSIDQAFRSKPEQQLDTKLSEGVQLFRKLASCKYCVFNAEWENWTVVMVVRCWIEELTSPQSRRVFKTNPERN
jgi:hypothetical protein